MKNTEEEMIASIMEKQSDPHKHEPTGRKFVVEVKGEFPIFFKPFAGQPCNR